MSRFHWRVLDFHRAMDIPIGDQRDPKLSRVKLRIDLMREELFELMDAAESGDLVSAIDGMVDLLYVIHGAAIEWGVDLDPFFDEVHEANMAKVGGPVREDGKRLKPPGWKPPDIAAVLERQKANHR